MEPAAHARRFQAQFLDGWSLAEQPVWVEVLEGGIGLRILTPGERALGTWTAAGLSSDAMQEGGVLHVTHTSAPQETLVVRDPELERQVLAICKQVSSLPGGQRRVRFIALLLGGLGLLGAALYYGTPIAARFVARRIPLEQERVLGAQIETFLDFSKCSDDSAEAALKVLAKRLAHSPSEVYEVRLMDSEMPNAFALPGGIVVMTTGLLHKAEDETEVAGVLAHEIEHVTQRHVLAGVVRDAVLSGIWALTMGDYAGLMVIDPSTAYRIANLEFSRSDEQEADDGAVMRLHRAGITHKGMIRFFERVQKDVDMDEGPEWLSTHPATATRIAKLQGVADVANAKPALDDEQRAALKHACEGTPGAGDGRSDHTDPGLLGGGDGGATTQP